MSDRVCVVGAGVAGIATAYALKQHGVAFDWFEGGSQPCGLWRYNNDNGRSAVYDSLITNTSAPKTSLFGFRIAELGASYLTHRQVLAYLEAFLNFSKLRPLIQTSTWITAIERPDSGKWRVSLRPGKGPIETREYSAVVIAIGRNWCPDAPQVPGLFEGDLLHSINYRKPDAFRGQRLVVAGFGNTGADIAVESVGVAESVILSTRAGGPLASRFVNGIPADQARPEWFYHLPLALRRTLASFRARRAPKSKGQQMLDLGADFSTKPPVINDRIADLVEAGRIELRPEIRGFEGRTVRFGDGSTVEADTVVWATGYKTSYPFFSKAMLERNGHFRDRYCRIVAPDEPGLYFVGQAAVVGPVFPVLEAQAQFTADAIAGKFPLPGTARQRAEAASESARNSRVLRQVTRGEDTVETYPYVKMLGRRSGR